MKFKILVLVFILSSWVFSQNYNSIYTWRWASDTVASYIDTLSVKIDPVTSPSTFLPIFNQWWGASIITDDTIEISQSSSFPAGKTIIYVSNDQEGALYIGPLWISNSENWNLYIRRYNVSGAVGTPRWKAFIGGF